MPGDKAEFIANQYPSDAPGSISRYEVYAFPFGGRQQE